MSVRYIYNSNGQYVAFISGENLFNPNCEWIGYVLNGNEVYNPNNASFIGYVLDDDRIARKVNEFQKLRPLKPLRPLRPLRPLKPLRRLRTPRLPYPYEDVFEAGSNPSKKLVTQSRINGEFTGWEGESIYELDNGQKWRQARYMYKYIYQYRPPVKIWQDGSRYYMEVANSGEQVEVVKVY